MTSRERIRAFLNRNHVDKIPNGFGGCETAGLHVLAYEALKRVLGVKDDHNRLYTFMSNAVFEPSVLQAMGGDFIIAGSGMCPSPMWTPDSETTWKTLKIWGITVQVPKDWQFITAEDGTIWWDDSLACPPGGLYFDVPASKLAERRSTTNPLPDPANYHPSDEIPEDKLLRMQTNARWLHETTEFSVVCGESICDLQDKPGGLQEWWMRMVSEPDACHEFLDKMVDAALSQLTQLEQAVGPYCETLLIADDMGDVRGVTIGPELWRSIYKPHYKRLFQGWKNRTGMRSVMHNCGSIAEILDDLIECGVDVINPLQTSAAGMDCRSLKKRFGERIILYGGAYDAVHLASEPSEEKVNNQVCENIRVLSKAGGYIFAGVHNLPADMPESHLRAMIEAYNTCAKNPKLLG